MKYNYAALFFSFFPLDTEEDGAGDSFRGITFKRGNKGTDEMRSIKIYSSGKVFQDFALFPPQDIPLILRFSSNTLCTLYILESVCKLNAQKTKRNRGTF